MRLSRIALVKGASWTIGTYAIGQALRVVTNFALTRILAPELFGLMIIVNSIRTGIDLISDVGIETNIVHNKNASNPEFYNTAWTLQIMRGLLLLGVSLAASVPLAHLFGIPDLAFLIPISGLYFAIGGFVSVGRFLVQKDLKFARVNVFELIVEVFSAATHIALALISPTVWALVFGSLMAGAGRMVGSYFLLPSLRYKVFVSKPFAREILGFGKWIFLSSSVYFLSMSFDRLYLGKVAPLAVLGVYGIARSLSEPFGALILRLGSYVVFPTIASSTLLPRNEVRKQFSSVRLPFLLLVITGLACFVSAADLIINFLYDQRYQAASWMLPLLIVGTWFSILSSLNEATLLGLGKPTYGAISNSVKLVYLFAALPAAFAAYGMLGAVIVIAASDLCRYVPILVGQLRERFSFASQDLLLSLALLLLITLLEWVRWKIGFGISFDSLQIS